MAATAISLHLRTKKPILNPSFLHHFSSSSSSSTPNPNSDTKTPDSPSPNPQTSESKSSFSSYFSDVKESLKNNPPPSPRHIYQQRFTPSTTKTASLDEIKKGLSEFRLPKPDPTRVNPSPPSVSFQAVYHRMQTAREGGSANESTLASIREKLRQLRPKTEKANPQIPFSLQTFKESFTLRPSDPMTVIGSSQNHMASVFSKELNEQEKRDTSHAMTTEFVKMYSYKELGEKLKKLRPEGRSEGGFTLEELNERLIKLREMEERETAAKIGNPAFRDLRSSLHQMKLFDAKTKSKQVTSMNYLIRDQIPSYMQQPPKEQLVEKYFHPDNMSSAEKLKIELQKVRDEFKMSETDCGSARVQVAQLTTKIKHLTTALHKKDKHSRKGLQGMIQQRKKLLKYLRRTDWDSYTLVLSKFGLRDNPDYKMLPKKDLKT